MAKPLLTLSLADRFLLPPNSGRAGGFGGAVPLGDASGRVRSAGGVGADGVVNSVGSDGTVGGDGISMRDTPCDIISIVL